MSNHFAHLIHELMRKHDLGVMHNPGGIQFTHNNPNLPNPMQSSGMDEREDYETLINHLRQAGLEK